MLIEFDPAKSSENRRKRGIGFERFAEMDLDRAISVEDALQWAIDEGIIDLLQFGPPSKTGGMA